MKKQYVLGIDHGSGGCKVTCLGSDGLLASEAYVSYPSYYDFPRWVEQEPEQWIEAAVQCIRIALAGFTEQERRGICAIGFSAPHHVAVLLDKNRQVLRRVIMWNDQRSGREAQYLAENYGDQIIGVANNMPASTWTLCHLLWLQKNEPKLYERIDKLVFMKDYIRFRFSGELATDYIDAEGSLFFDIHRREWSEPLLSVISLDCSVLPKVKSPTDYGGKLLPEIAERTGLPVGIPVIMGTADTAAEVYGCGAVEEGDGIIKLATAGNFNLISGKLPANHNIIVYDHVVNGLYYQNSATNFAASSFRWLKETFYKEVEEKVTADQIYQVLNHEIARIGPGAEGLIFHPYLNGERSPYWDPYLRASFFGLTARHGRSHFARAVMEGVGFSLRDAGAEYAIRSSKPLKIVGGGSKSAVWTQIMADILNSELEVPQLSDASFGICLITATAIGWYSDLKQSVKQLQKISARITPNSENMKIYDEMFQIYKELQANTKHLAHRISKLMESV